MTKILNSIEPEDFFTESGYLDQGMEATKARAMVWQLMQKVVQENASSIMTLAGLSATVTQSAARILGMDEDDLAQLLRDYPPH